MMRHKMLWAGKRNGNGYGAKAEAESVHRAAPTQDPDIDHSVIVMRNTRLAQRIKKLKLLQKVFGDRYKQSAYFTSSPNQKQQMQQQQQPNPELQVIADQMRFADA